MEPFTANTRRTKGANGSGTTGTVREPLVGSSPEGGYVVAPREPKPELKEGSSVSKPLTPEHRAKISASRRGGVPAHGTTARYKGSSARKPCRCRPCKSAWAARA